MSGPNILDLLAKPLHRDRVIFASGCLAGDLLRNKDPEAAALVREALGALDPPHQEIAREHSLPAALLLIGKLGDGLRDLLALVDAALTPVRPGDERKALKDIRHEVRALLGVEVTP